MIKLKIIPNMFDREGRTESEVLTTGEGTPLLDLIDEKYRKGEWRLIHSRDGYIAPEQWESTIVYNGDEIIITPVVEGPETWLLVGAMILAAASVGVPVGAVFVIAGIGMVGYGMYSMMQPIKPAFSGSGNLSDSPTYGWDGVQNTANVGVPVPIIYGEHRVAGNYINQYSTRGIPNENEDDDDDTTKEYQRSYLNILIALGEGPVQSIAGITTDTDATVTPATIGDKIKINGNPISNFEGCKVYTRMGNQEQTVIPGFGDLHNLVDYNDELLKDDSNIYTTTDMDVQAIVLHFTASSIIKMETGSATWKAQTIQATVEYRKSGIDGEPWTECRYHKAKYKYGGGEGGDGSFPTVSFEIHAKEQNEYRYEFRIDGISEDITDGLAPYQYDVRITKISPDSNEERNVDFYLSGVDEIRYDDLAYPYTALLGLKVLATSQISGALNSVTTMVQGRTVDYYDGATWTNVYPSGDGDTYRNPIWCLHDLLTNSRYGVGDYISSEHISAAHWKIQADYCDGLEAVEGGSDETRFRLDLVMDSDSSATDWISTICASFLCFPIWTAGAVMPVIDKPESPVQLISAGNTIAGSFVESFSSINQSANVIEIQFANEENDYERETIQIENEVAMVAGDPIRKKTMFLAGVTRLTQAGRVGRYLLNLSRYCTRSISFSAGIDQIALQAGDVFDFASNIPQWGVGSGRVKSGTASTVKLKANVTLATLASGETNLIRIRHADDSYEEATISSPAGVYAAGSDISIVGTFDTTPAAFDVYTVGTTPAKPFRALEIANEEDGIVKVTALEYHSEVYAYTGQALPPINYTALPDPFKIPAQCENVKATSKSAYDVTIYVSFSVPELDLANYGVWDRAEILMSTDGGSTYRKIGESEGDMFAVKNLAPGVTYYFKAVSITKWDIKANVDNATAASILVQPPELPVVRGLRLTESPGGNEFVGPDATFQWNDIELYTLGAYGAGEEPFGAGSGVQRNPYILGYRVEIRGTSDNKWGRVEHITDPTYTYSLDKNRADFGTARRDITIKVWAEDIFNQISVYPAWIEVKNPAPAALGNITAVTQTYIGVDGDGNHINSAVFNKSEEIDVDRYLIHVIYWDGGTFIPRPDLDVYIKTPSNTLIVYHVAGTEFSINVAVADTFADPDIDWTNPDLNWLF